MPLARARIFPYEPREVSVLYDGTRTLFEEAGFGYVRPKGTRNCVMRIEVSAAAQA